MDTVVNSRGYTGGDNRGMPVSKPPKPWTTFQERLFEAMAKEGVWTPADLARKLKVQPQTAYKWWAGQTENISARDLYRIADAFKVSARWLVGLRADPGRATALTESQQRVLDLYSALGRAHGGWAEHWMSQGNDLLNRLSVPASPAHPYPKAPKR